MGKFNEELIKAGVVLAMDGLQPSSKGARVKFSDKNRTVIDGPFTEAKELIAGFWLWQVKSLEEAIERVLPIITLKEGSRARVYIGRDILIPSYAEHRVEPAM